MRNKMCSAIVKCAVILVLMVWSSEAGVNNKKCYIARTCIHSGNERCAVDADGNYRRFFDSCDILEYNCLYDTSFKKVPYSKCSQLPPLEPIEELVDQKKLALHDNKKHATYGYM